MSSTTKRKKYKLCRRLGSGIFEKCQSQKYLLAEGKGRRASSRPTDYGNQMIEKQKVRITYGLRERQFRNYVNEAMVHGKRGVSPANLLYQFLEQRLDNVVYRLGIAHTRALARQMVSHGHITVGGRKVTVPSLRTRTGTIIGIRPGSKESPLFKDLDVKLKNVKAPQWLSWEGAKNEGVVVGAPKDPDNFLNFQAVIEFYSR